MTQHRRLTDAAYFTHVADTVAAARHRLLRPTFQSRSLGGSAAVEIGGEPGYLARWVDETFTDEKPNPKRDALLADIYDVERWLARPTAVHALHLMQFAARSEASIPIDPISSLVIGAEGVELTTRQAEIKRTVLSNLFGDQYCGDGLADPSAGIGDSALLLRVKESAGNVARSAPLTLGGMDGAIYPADVPEYLSAVTQVTGLNDVPGLLAGRGLLTKIVTPILTSLSSLDVGATTDAARIPPSNPWKPLIPDPENSAEQNLALSLHWTFYGFIEGTSNPSAIWDNPVLARNFSRPVHPRAIEGAEALLAAHSVLARTLRHGLERTPDGVREQIAPAYEGLIKRIESIDAGPLFPSDIGTARRSPTAQKPIHVARPQIRHFPASPTGPENNSRRAPHQRDADPLLPVTRRPGRDPRRAQRFPTTTTDDASQLPEQFPAVPSRASRRRRGTVGSNEHQSPQRHIDGGTPAGYGEVSDTILPPALPPTPQDRPKRANPNTPGH